MNPSRIIAAALLMVVAAFPKTTIVSPENASPLEKLAAREVRRYFYLRTGELAPVVTRKSVV